MDYKQLENLVRECQQKENELFWEQKKLLGIIEIYGLLVRKI
jgi:hypothetical protein